MSDAPIHYDLSDPDDQRDWVELAVAIGPARRTHAGLVDAFVSWASPRGRPVDADVAALVLAAGIEGFSRVTTTRWTRHAVAHMACCHVPNWSDLHRSLLPDADDAEEVEAETLWLLLTFLVETGRLDPESDPLDALLLPLRCRGFDLDGRSAELEVLDRYPSGCPDHYDGPTHGELASLEVAWGSDGARQSLGWGTTRR